MVSPPGTYTYVYPVDTAAYKASRQVTRISLPNTSFITNTFDAVGRQLSTLLKNSAGTVLNGHTYVVNKAAQRTKQTRTDGSYVNYSYDNASELREGLTFTSGNAAVNAENFAFGYDTAQSMKARTNNTTVSTYTVNALNQVTADGSYTYSYDLNGNRTGKLQTGSVYYTYDDENQLIRAETDTVSTPTSSQWITEWQYDARGRMRVRLEYAINPIVGWRLVSETRYLYDGRRVIQERDGNNTPLVTYVRGLDLSGTFEGAGGIGGLLSRTAHSGGNGVTLTHAFYHADANGNITKLLDGSQSSVADYKYDPFGRTISSSGTLAAANVYRFSSKELMAQCGFYYYGFRFYDPVTQRWINRDPLEEEGGLNLYAMVKNNPANSFDPYGLAEGWGWDNLFGIGSVNNCTSNTFNGLASWGGSWGRNGPDAPVKIPPGKTGGRGTNAPAMFKGNPMRDIDFLYPSAKQPINGKTNGAFKIGANEIKLTPDPKNPRGCLADNYNSWSTNYPVKISK